MNPVFAIGLPHGMEWIWIFLIFILVFGADKIPKLARGLGKSLGEFKKAKEDFERELHGAANTPAATTTTTQPALDEKMRVATSAPSTAAVPTPVSSDSVSPTDELTKKI